jgi:hypothetical protein
MPRPSHSPACSHPNNVWWAAQIMKLLTVQFSPFSRHLLRPKYPSQHPTLKHPQFMFFTESGTVSVPYKRCLNLWFCELQFFRLAKKMKASSHILFLTF